MVNLKVPQESRWVFYSKCNPVPEEFNWDELTVFPCPVPFSPVSAYTPNLVCEPSVNTKQYDPIEDSVYMGHGGRTDWMGGHVDRRTGKYHFHSGILRGTEWDSKDEAYSAFCSAKKQEVI